MSQQRLVFYINNVSAGKEFDNMLWTWKQSSFIPHLYCDKLNQDYDEPIVITPHVESASGYNILLMFDPAPIEVLAQFDLIIDFAEKYDIALVKKSRERYREYTNKNWQVDSITSGHFLQMSLE